MGNCQAFLETGEAKIPQDLGAEPRTETLYAICVLEAVNNSNVSGVVKFIQAPQGRTIINAFMKGLKPGFHGMRIHEFGNFTNGLKSSGVHFNPFKRTHGAPNEANRHMGDIGNIKKEYKVNWASLSTEDPMIQLSGSYRIIGRTLVVHAADDDFGKGLFEDSKEEGHAGPVVAFGIIGHSAPFQYAQPGEKVPEEIREEEEQRKKI